MVSTVDLDGQQYVYIQTVPHYAHRITPMFDQPNLKAVFDITVAVPGKWHSITTGDVVESCSIDKFYSAESFKREKLFYTQSLNHFSKFGYLPAEDYFKVNVHAKTPLLASYLLNLVCGPFAKYELAEEERYDNIPMSIYCRESLGQYVEAEKDNIFSFNKAGIKFYNNYFKYKYPYTRLDMAFCPEFSWSAMEYPGAITYSEVLLPRE